MSAVVDVVVVGAGAAGLAAARQARQLGLSVVLLEAMNRSGGRAHTDFTTFGYPWDVGCHWLHSASINPYRELADHYGFTYHRQTPLHRYRSADGWLNPEEQARIDASWNRLEAAVAAAGRTGTDQSVAEVVDPTEPAYPYYRCDEQAGWATDIHRIAVRDLGNYNDTHENWPVEDGYGALVQRHHQGLPVELNTPVRAIDWQGPTVRVDTNNGTLEATTVVITVSTGVLTARSIRFDPALPDWKLAAIDAVPLGRAGKVAFAIDRRHFDISEPTAIFAPLSDTELMTFRLGPYGKNLADGYLAGPVCRELEDAGDAAVIAAGKAALVSVFGSDIEKQITAETCTNWGTEPTILGAYAAALPGQDDKRADLARSIDDRLFFAGEATSPDFFTTCHGAHLSGIAAIEEVARVLGRVPVA